MRLLLKTAAAALLSTSLLTAAPETVEIGKKAPDFTAVNQTGEEVKLSSYTGKNVILVVVRHSK